VNHRHVQQNISSPLRDRLNHLGRSMKIEQALNKIVDQSSRRLRSQFRGEGNHAWFIAGELLWKCGRFQEALFAYRKAARLWPADSQAIFAMANCYSELGRPRLAERFYRRCLEMDPKNGNVAYNLANSLFDQRRYQETIPLYQLASRLGGVSATLAKKNLTLARGKLTPR
jgi:tetratricopeptide (TPR) repeat protein